MIHWTRGRGARFANRRHRWASPAGCGTLSYAAIAAIVAFIMSGHRSVYASQVLGLPKTRSLSLRRGVELGAGAEIDARLALVRWRAFRRMLGRLRRGRRG